MGPYLSPGVMVQEGLDSRKWNWIRFCCGDTHLWTPQAPSSDHHEFLIVHRDAVGQRFHQLVRVYGNIRISSFFHLPQEFTPSAHVSIIGTLFVGFSDLQYNVLLIPGPLALQQATQLICQAGKLHWNENGLGWLSLKVALSSKHWSDSMQWDHWRYTSMESNRLSISSLLRLPAGSLKS